MLTAYFATGETNIIPVGKLELGQRFLEELNNQLYFVHSLNIYSNACDSEW